MDVSPKTTRGTDTVFSDNAPVDSGEVDIPMACRILPPTRSSPSGCGGASSGVLQPAKSTAAARLGARNFFMDLLTQLIGEFITGVIYPRLLKRNSPTGQHHAQ